LLGTKACTWPSCTDKKNLPVFLTFQLLAFFCLHPVLQTLNLLLLVSELLAGLLVQLEEVTQTTQPTKFLIYNVKGVHAQRQWHFTESDGAVSNAILRLAF
jgi:hypothetical protein